MRRPKTGDSPIENPISRTATDAAIPGASTMKDVLITNGHEAYEFAKEASSTEP